jgi:SAM-dependent methyltransferase
MDYLQVNKASWNQRVDIHVRSDFYDMAGFMGGESSLNDIELDLLGDIRGKSILHLQCHFGQDSISLARLGAKVTGIDLSDVAVAKAKELAEQCGVDAHFVCCDVLDLPNHLLSQFDIVFTSYGTIGWLPDLATWGQVVSHFLKPGGQFLIVEFHPVVWMFDNDFEKVAYRYFKDGPIIETDQGTYAERDHPIVLQSITWNHSLEEVFMSLIRQGLQITEFKEYDYSPYNCFSKTVQLGPKKYCIEHLGDKIPMVFALMAKK